MRKIVEINGPELYQQTGLMPWTDGPKSPLNPQWIKLAFTAAQLKFLLAHEYAIRCHPRHSPTLEVFINEHSLSDTDHTVQALLF